MDCAQTLCWKVVSFDGDTFIIDFTPPPTHYGALKRDNTACHLIEKKGINIDTEPDIIVIGTALSWFSAYNSVRSAESETPCVISYCVYAR